MKKTLLIIALITSSLAHSQQWEVTANGLVNSENTSESHLVLNFKELNAKMLYDNSIKYIKENYNSPDDVIKSKTNGEYLRFETYVPQLLIYNSGGAKFKIECKYMVELKFKDDKIRYEIVQLKMPSKTSSYEVKFSGGLMSGYIIYKKNGKLYKPKTKAAIENYFNAKVAELFLFITADNENKDW